MLKIKSFTFSPIAENSYVLYAENRDCAIIDPGCYFDDEKSLLADFIYAENLQPVLLINTHCHLDHVFGNKYVAEKFGLTLSIHPDEKAVLDFAPTSGLMYNLPFDNYDGKLEHLQPGTELRLGDNTLKILLTPGHSPGSLSFYSEEGGFVIAGDALFKNSIGRTVLPGGDHQLLLKSIREQLLTLPDNTVVYSGHGEPTTIGAERANNPFLS